VAIRARQVGDHAAPTTFVAKRVGPHPAVKQVALGQHRSGRLEQRREEAPLVLLGRRQAGQPPIPKHVVAVISPQHIPTLTAVERIRERASPQSIVTTAAVDIDRHGGGHRVAAVAGQHVGHQAGSARWARDQLLPRRRAARPRAQRRPRIRDMELPGRPTRHAQAISLAPAAPHDEPLAIVRWAQRPGAVELQPLEPNLGALGHRDQREGERHRDERTHKTGPSQGHPQTKHASGTRDAPSPSMRGTSRADTGEPAHCLA
jgi:hypothetical protein